VRLLPDLQLVEIFNGTTALDFHRSSVR
jgi:hypothetical protein